MARSSYTEILNTLLADKLINQEEVVLYQQQYDHFEDSRSSIVQSCRGAHGSRWVASLNGQFYFAGSFAELSEKIVDLPNAKYAYCEELVQ